MANESALAIATNVFTAPGEAFPAIKEHRRPLLPLLALVVGFSAVAFLYMHEVDFAWFIDQQIRMSNVDMTDEQREQAVEAALKTGPTVYGVIGAVGISGITLAWMFVVSLYYTGVSFVTGDGVKLKQWFALICWCSLPLVLGLLAQIVNILAGDARFMAQDEVNPLAFGNLLSIDRTNVTLVQRILLGIDLTALWAIALTVLGYQAFTRSSIVKSVVVVLGPVILIVAISTAVALAR